jgi:antitoxin component YwqK of YwqJK toxin-antitoxin module
MKLKKCLIYYDWGQLMYHYHIKNGQIHGIDQNWYGDGRRHFVKQYKNHQRNGPEITFNY